MRLVKREEFLKLPIGTAYAKGTPFAFGGLQFKAESYENDWWYLDPVWVEANDTGEAFDRLEEMLSTGASYDGQTSLQRDGCYDDKEIFMVFEAFDLELLRSAVENAMGAKV